MADEYLYSFEQLCKLLEHPSPAVCRWAIGRLDDCYPAQMPASIGPLFRHVDEYVIPAMCRLLGRHGDLAVHGPQLHEQLTKLPLGSDLAAIIDACRMLKDTEAIAIFMERLKKDERALELNVGISWGHMLSEMKPKFARTQFHQWITHPTNEKIVTEIMLDLYLEVAELEVFREQVGKWRLVEDAWGRMGNHLFFVRDKLGVNLLAADIKLMASDGVEAAREAGALHGGVDQLPPSFWSRIDFKAGIDSIPSLCLEQFRILAEERGWALDDWDEAWNRLTPLTSFQKQVVFCKAVLEELVKPPPQTGTVDATDEAVTCLAILISLETSRDDAVFVDAAADRRRAIEELLRSPREGLFVDITPLCLEIGLDFVPVLRDLVSCGDDDQYTAILRAVECIPEFEIRWPGSCADLAKPLIDLLKSDLGDSMNEAAYSALVSIGPAALDELIPVAFEKNDVNAYLYGSLSRIPTPRAVEAFLAADMPLDESVVESIGELCSPAFIPVLMNDDERSEVAQTLCLICDVNGLNYPDYSRWTRIVQEGEEQMASVREMFASAANKSTPKTNNRLPTKPKVSRKARKAAAARKKRNRKRKKR